MDRETMYGNMEFCIATRKILLGFLSMRWPHFRFQFRHKYLLPPMKMQQWVQQIQTLVISTSV